jgi:hypothetical protein
MEEENKGSGIFWALLLVLGGGAVWAINKFIVAPKKDTQNSSNIDDTTTDTTATTTTPTKKAFDYKTFLNGKWSMKYTDGINNGVESGTITNGDTYTIDGGETRKLTNISYDKATKTLRFTEVPPTNIALPETVVVIDTSKKTMVGTNGGWQVSYSKDTSNPSVTTAAPEFDFIEFLNGKWHLEYSDSTNNGTEEITFEKYVNPNNANLEKVIGYSNGDGDTYEATVKYNQSTNTLTVNRKMINHYINGVAKPPLSIKYPTETLKVDEQSGTMAGVDANGLNLKYYKIGVAVIPVLSTSGSTVLQPITNNIVTYKNGWSLDTNTNILIDANGYMVGDGVASYDEANYKVNYKNGYTLITNGTKLLDNNGVQISQKFNPKNLPISRTFQTTKICGYSSLNNIFFYNDEGTTPYSVIDGDDVMLPNGISSVVAEKPDIVNGNSVLVTIPISTVKPVACYSSIKVFNAFPNCGDNYKTFFYIKSCENQCPSQNPILKVLSYKNVPITRSKADYLIANSVAPYVYESNIQKDYQIPIYTYTLYTPISMGNICRGYGVNTFDLKKMVIDYGGYYFSPITHNLLTNELFNVSMNNLQDTQQFEIGQPPIITNNVKAYIDPSVMIYSAVDCNGNILTANAADATQHFGYVIKY